MLGKKLEAEDSQYLLGIAAALTHNSTVLESRIKERHEAICQLMNQMLGELEEINKAYYVHAVELIDIAASLSAREQLGSVTPEAIELNVLDYWQGPAGSHGRLGIEDDKSSEVATNGTGAGHCQKIEM